MMELKPEYEAIRADMLKDYEVKGSFAREAIKEAVERCQALTDRPPLMLTDEEICDVWNEGGYVTQWSFVRAAIAAHIKKQSAPEVVPFNFELWQQGGWVALNADGIKQYHLYSNTKYTSMVRES